MPVFKGLYYSIAEEGEEKGLVLTNNNSNHTKVTGEMVEVLEQIIPMLDGNHKTSEISTILNVSRKYIDSVVDILTEKNFVVLNDVKDNIRFVKGGNELEKYFSNYLNKKTDILQQLNIFSDSCIYIIGDKTIKNYLVKKLESIINVVEVNNLEDIDENECNLVIACESYENISFFKDVGEKSSNNNLDFLKLVVGWDEVKLGPIFTRGDLCYGCYMSRIYSNNPNYKYITKGNAVVSNNLRNNFPPGSVEIAAGLLKVQLIKFFSSILKADIVLNEYVISLQDFTSQVSPVYSIPNCEECDSGAYKEIKGGEYTYEIG